MDTENSVRHVIGGGIGWAVAIAPVALFAIVWGVPHCLEILGWICQALRDVAAAVKE